MRRVTTLAPYYADGWNNNATLLQKVGRSREAEAAYRTAIEIHPGFAAAHSNLGNGLRLRATNTARAWVDGRFLSELRRVCRERFAGRGLLRCRVRARAMHTAVRLFNPPWA